MADNNVFILFEEIRTALNGIKSKVEELPRVENLQLQIENDEQEKQSQSQCLQPKIRLIWHR